MTFDSTRRACYTGYVTQAIVNNLAPLLFIVFQTRYDVPVEMLGRLVLLNFATQLVTDVIAVKVVDRVGYRGPLVLAHILAGFGLILLSVAPSLAPSPYLGLCVAVIVYAVGGGLLEVLVSPVVDALPTPQAAKAAQMSLLHSFYCWGQVGVVALTTVLLAAIGQGSWQVLPLVWAIVPLINLIAFLRVPLPATVADEHRMPLRALLAAPTFGIAMILMLCAGAAELTMSQWASLFAEEGLGVSKVWGDLTGPCLFAILMGIGRMAYGLWGERIPLLPALVGCGSLATACYLVAALSGSPVVSLVGCALCGLAVSLLWPGTFSLAAARFPLGGAAMFGVLAVFGDAGGAGGPWITGAVADLASSAGGGALRDIAATLPGGDDSGLRVGLLVGTFFPVAMVVAALLYAAATRGRRTSDRRRRSDADVHVDASQDSV
jgi:fucose permease